MFHRGLLLLVSLLARDQVTLAHADAEVPEITKDTAIGLWEAVDPMDPRVFVLRVTRDGAQLALSVGEQGMVFVNRGAAFELRDGKVKMEFHGVGGLRISVSGRGRAFEDKFGVIEARIEQKAAPGGKDLVWTLPFYRRVTAPQTKIIGEGGKRARQALGVMDELR